MKTDLAAFLIGLIACIVGVLALAAGFLTMPWHLLGFLAPFVLISMGAVAIIMAVRRRS
ncbi:MAG: hypothetical protein LBR58_04755 [Propionibacteriaceae bacterium]|jgi:hypothetical protein|nr:hypothetical protein [Propionibacteriaceae bacterium]